MRAAGELSISKVMTAPAKERAAAAAEYVTTDIGKQEVIDRHWDDSFRRLKNRICFLYPFDREKIAAQLDSWADMEKNPELRKKLYGKHADKF